MALRRPHRTRRRRSHPDALAAVESARGDIVATRETQGIMIAGVHVARLRATSPITKERNEE
jgi:hypothetical protein